MKINMIDFILSIDLAWQDYLFQEGNQWIIFAIVGVIVVPVSLFISARVWAYKITNPQEDISGVAVFPFLLLMFAGLVYLVASSPVISLLVLACFSVMFFTCEMLAIHLTRHSK